MSSDPTSVGLDGNDIPSICTSIITRSIIQYPTQMSYAIHEGFWIDWTRGKWTGATITFTERNGGLLLVFTATFVTLVMIRLWRVASFICHQVCASEEAHDALQYQRQMTFRNVSSPVVAAKFFLLRTWCWRRGRAAAKQP